MLILKSGVRLEGLAPEMSVALIAAERVYAEKGLDCVITSAVRPGEKNLLHAKGRAVDIRISNIATRAATIELHKRLRAALTTQFDVVLERDHIHIEFDPKPSNDPA
jgi:hypothetical protein